MNLLGTALVVVFTAAVVSAGGFLVAARWIPRRWLVADSDGASTIYATVGMVYAILIAVAAIAVWEPRTAVSDASEQEASALVEMHWAANGLAPADKAEIQGLIVAYLTEASGPEWNHLRDSRTASPEGEALFTKLRQRIVAVTPASDAESTAWQQLSGYASQAASARLSRLSVANAGLPNLMWWILIAGAAISVVFFYMFGLKPTFPNAVMLAIVGGMLALMVFVIYQVEFPYSRGFAVAPSSLQSAITDLLHASPG